MIPQFKIDVKIDGKCIRFSSETRELLGIYKVKMVVMWLRLLQACDEEILQIVNVSDHLLFEVLK